MGQRHVAVARGKVDITLTSAPLVRLANPSDQRRLMAVLVALELDQTSADTLQPGGPGWSAEPQLHHHSNPVR